MKGFHAVSTWFYTLSGKLCKDIMIITWLMMQANCMPLQKLKKRWLNYLPSWNLSRTMDILHWMKQGFISEQAVIESTNSNIFWIEAFFKNNFWFLDSLLHCSPFIPRHIVRKKQKATNKFSGRTNDISRAIRDLWCSDRNEVRYCTFSRFSLGGTSRLGPARVTAFVSSVGVTGTWPLSDDLI